MVDQTPDSGSRQACGALDEYPVAIFGNLRITNQRVMYGTDRYWDNASASVALVDIESFDTQSTYLNSFVLLGLIVLAIGTFVELTTNYFLACLIGGLSGICLGLIFPTVYLEILCRDLDHGNPLRLKIEYCSKRMARDIENKLDAAIEAASKWA